MESVIDAHAHLDHGPEPAEALIAAARAAGVRRILAIGMDADSCRTALALAEEHEEVCVAIGRHPNLAQGFDDAAAQELAELARHPRCRAIGETGLDYYRDRAPRADQARAFQAQMDLARATGKPLVIHTRAAEEDTLAALGEHADGISVVLHCFSMPARLDECLDRGWWISFAGNVTYPTLDRAGGRRRAGPARPPARRDRRPVALAPAAPRPPQPAGQRRAHGRAFSPSAQGIPYEALEAAGRGERRPPVRVVTTLPAQPSLRRLREHGVRPNRDLGQNFLIDSNLLDVIARAAELDAGDVVLEMGGGLGVLSEHLAARVRTCTSSRSTAALEPPLREALDPYPERDAAPRGRDAARPRRARPGADQGRGQPALRDRGDGRSCARSRSCRGRDRWVAMVQREVGERFAARSRGRAAYGIPSRARPARLRRARAAPDLADASSSRARTSTRCSSACGAGARAAARAARVRAGRVRAPAQGARALAGARAPGGPRGTCATAPARRSTRSAIRPTRAPSGSRREELRALWTALRCR